MRKKISRWAVTHFEPSISFSTKEYWFGVIEQKGGKYYSVKAIRMDLCDFALDEGEWIKTTADEGQWETESGACYGILCFLEEKAEQGQP